MGAITNPAGVTVSATWHAVSDAARTAGERPAIVQELARTYAPTLGSLSPRHAQHLSVAAADALEGAYVLPVHSSNPRWVPSMLDEGFGWQRPRIDSFEPYEDKLREWRALGRGERSEDFLFTGLRVYTADVPLSRAIQRAAQLDDPHSLGTGYGEVALAFTPQLLRDATIVPAVDGLAHYGSQAGTIEHLPAIISQRIAADHGFLLDTETRGLRLLGREHEAVAREAASGRLQSELIDLIDGDHDSLVTGIRRHLDERLNGNWIEAHVRRPVPDDVAHVDVIRPTLHGVDAQVAVHEATLPGAPQVRYATGVLHAMDIDAIERSTRRLGIPTTGLDHQRSALAALDAVQDVQFPLLVRRGPLVTYVELDEPTALRTAALRRQMAAAR